MCDGSLQQAMDGTCCETYICSRQRLRCPTVECTLPSRPNRIRGTSFVETFVCELQILRCLFRTHIGFGDLKLDKNIENKFLKLKQIYNKSRHCLLHIRFGVRPTIIPLIKATAMVGLRYAAWNNSFSHIREQYEMNIQKILFQITTNGQFLFILCQREL